jgi:hypothetical protein
MSQIQSCSAIILERFELKLLDVEDMVKLTSKLMERFNIQGEDHDNMVYRQFLSVLLGNPRLFANFLSTCSQYCIPVIDLPDVKKQLPFSIEGFATFVKLHYFSNKAVLWECMNNLYENLKVLDSRDVFTSLATIQNRECFLSLLDMMINQDRLVERTT